MSRFAKAIGTKCDIVQPITSMLIELRIFANFSAGSDTFTSKAGFSASNSSVVCMYTLMDDTRTIAKNGSIALRTNLEASGRV